MCYCMCPEEENTLKHLDTVKFIEGIDDVLDFILPDVNCTHFPVNSHLLSKKSSFLTNPLWLLWTDLEASNRVSLVTKAVCHRFHFFSFEEGRSLESPVKLPTFVCWTQTMSPASHNSSGSRKQGGDRGWESSAGVCSPSTVDPLTPRKRQQASHTCCQLAVWVHSSRNLEETGALGFIVSTKVPRK